MARITWILADGRTISAEVSDGTNLMMAAVNNDVPGVIGECGGCLSCATCHVHVDPAWRDKTGVADDSESAMLEITETGKAEGSRLSCQIVSSPDLDGLILRVPV